MQLKHSFTVPTGIDQAWEVLLDIERIAPCMPGAAIETVDGDDFTGTVKVRLGPIGLTYKGKASFVEKDATEHRAVIDAQGKDSRGNGTAKAIITATLMPLGDGTAVNVVTDLNITGKPAQFGRGVMVDVGNKLIGQFADCLAGKLTGPDAGELGTAELTTAELATAQRLASADLEGAERLGTADLAPDQAAGEAVVALPGPMPDEQPVEPAAAAEAAPPAHRISDAGVVSADRPAAVPTVAQRPPAHRPTAAEVEPIDLLGSAGPAVAKRLAPVVAGALVALLFLLRRRRNSASRSAERQAAAEYRAAMRRWVAAGRQLATERRSSVEQRQLDRRVLRLAGVLGKLAERASARPAVRCRRPGGFGRSAS
ncbi:MAG: SRPBCC family protein [Jatrophihabitantaceae bacterium]